MKDCEYYREKISCLMDGELSPEETAGLEAHIEGCPECRALYEAFTAVSAALSEGMGSLPNTLLRPSCRRSAPSPKKRSAACG